MSFNMARKLPISVIIETAAAFKKIEERAEFLRKHDSTALQTVLKYGLDPKIKWALPEGAPPYKECQALDIEGMLYSEARRLYLFVEGGNQNLTKLKREMLFINMLESLHPKDAQILIAAKDKKLPKGITVKVVNLAFPRLIEDE
jgi:hypothetical protein